MSHSRSHTLPGVAPAPLRLTEIDQIREARRELASWHVAFSLGRKTAIRALYVLDLIPAAPLVHVESIDIERYLSLRGGV